MKQISRLTAVVVLMMLSIGAQAIEKPFGPIPNANQLRWQDMEMYAFIHYSLNTYTAVSYTHLTLPTILLV